jgi:6-pyruvoyltetrahydropterin/6-carboxytetrahydropterin synthase
MTFQSTKRFGPISTCHRNWQAAHNTNRDSKKCSLIHGYSRYLKLTFEGELDNCSWVMDFGNLRDVKDWLDNNWDHKVLVSSDDPELETLRELEEKGILYLTVIKNENDCGPGIEGSCKHVFENIQPIISEKTRGRVHISKVEIWEHENNSSIFTPTTQDIQRLTYSDSNDPLTFWGNSN